MERFVRRFFAAALGAVILSCGDSHPTGPDESAGIQIKTDAISSEGAAGPTIVTDRLDYAPGDTVVVTGAGWQPNESISLVLTTDSAVRDTAAWNVVADTLGAFVDRTFEVQETDLGLSFRLIATGAATADTAQGLFTDADLSMKSNFGIMSVNLKYFAGSATCAGGPDSTVTNVSIGTTAVPTYRGMTATNGLLVFAMTPPTGMTFVNWTAPGAGGGSTVTTMLSCFNGAKTWTANFAFNTTTVLAADSTSPEIAGTPITFTATVTKDADNSAVTVDKVKFYDGGTDCSAGAGTPIGNASGVNLSGSGTASVTTSSLSIGTHTIRACFQGNPNGSDPDLLASSGTLSFTINAASVATSTAITPSPASPSEFGTSVTFTANVTQTSGGAAVTTGNIAFRDTDCSGTVLQAAAAVNGSGQKTYTTSSLAVGAHTIAACYEGATGFDPSSGTTAYTINKIATTSGITANKTSPQPVGTSITFTTTVTRTTGGAAVTVGNVRFIEGGTCASPTTTHQAATAVNGSGQVAFTTSGLAVGSHTIVGCYDGDTSYEISNGSMGFTIDSAATTTTVTPSPASPSEYGTSVTFTAAVTSGGSPVTTGNISFHSTNCAGTLLQAAAAINGSGEKTYTTSSLPLGANTIAACYEGSANYATSNGTSAYTINKIATGTAVTADKTSPQTVGTSITFKAAVTRTTGGAAVTVGNVRFIEGGTCAAPTTTLQAATAVNGSGEVTYTTTSLGVGAHTIVGCYDGDTNYEASTGSKAFTIDAATTLTVVTPSPASPSEYGTSVTFTAAVTSSGSAVTGGNVRFVSGTCDAPTTTLQAASAVNGSGEVAYATSSLAVGAHTIRACYDGTATYATSTGTAGYTITRIGTTTALSSDVPSPQEFGTSIVFTAEVNRTTGGADVKQGKVAFYEGGSCAAVGTLLQAAGDVDTNGKKTYSTSSLAVGSHTIVACYEGNDTLATSGDSKSYEITKIQTTTSLSPSVSSPKEYGTAVTFTAEVNRTSGGTDVTVGNVTFYEGGSCAAPGTSLQTGAVSGTGTATYTPSPFAVGNHTIVACYSGNSDYEASGDSEPFTVNKIGTGTTLTSDLASSQEFGTSITFTAEVNRTTGGSDVKDGSVAFYEGGTCSSVGALLQAAGALDSNGKKTYTTSSLSVGNHTIVACYEGNDTLATSGDSKPYTITKILTTTSVTPSLSTPREYGTSLTFTAKVTRTNGGADVTTGNVVFYEGTDCSTGTQIQAAQAVSGTGTVAYATSSLSVGAHNILACYEESSTYAGSNDVEPFTINKIGTTTALTSDIASPQTWGTSIVFTAEVDRTVGGAAVTQGNVAFYEGGTCAAPGATLQAAGAVDSNGKKTFTTSTLSVGSHTILACYLGNDTLATSNDSEPYTINKIPTTVTLTLTPGSSQQYSDKVRLSAFIAPTGTAGSVQFQKKVGVAAYTDVGSPVAVSGDSAAYVYTIVESSIDALSFKAIFTPTDTDHYDTDDDSKGLTVTKEDAKVGFDSNNPAAVQVTTPGGSFAGSVSFLITVREKTPDAAASTAAAGDIDNSGLTASLTPIGGGSAIPLSCSLTGDNNLAGYDEIRTYTCSYNSGLVVNTYQLDATVTGNYYAGSDTDAFTVYDPSLGFATGGGTFNLNGDRVNFGFTMKYNKSGANLQGNLIAVRHHPDGTVSRIKSNALAGLALTDDGCGIAQFNGKATYSTWSSSINDYVNTGNNTFYVYAKDCNNPGTGVDYIWIDGPGNLDMPGNGESGKQQLTGGNIAVPHKPAR